SESSTRPGDDATAARRRVWLIAAAAVVLLGASGIWWALSSGTPSPGSSSLQVRSITTSGRASQPAISPDGRLVVYVAEASDKTSLRLIQRATGADVELVAPSALQYAEPRFSPDGAYVYYSASPDGFFTVAAWRVAAIGGPAKLFLADAGTTPAFSPDGRSVVVVRTDMSTLVSSVTLRNVSEGSSRVLLELPGAMHLSVGWS